MNTQTADQLHSPETLPDLQARLAEKEALSQQAGALAQAEGEKLTGLQREAADLQARLDDKIREVNAQRVVYDNVLETRVRADKAFADMIAVVALVKDYFKTPDPLTDPLGPPVATGVQNTQHMDAVPGGRR